MSAPAADRRGPPPPGELTPYEFPAFEHRRLPCGIDLYHCRSRRTPLLSLQLSLEIGAQFDPPGRAGLAALTAGLLDEGTTNRSVLEIASEAEHFGGYLATGADWDGMSVSTGVLGHHVEPALDLMSDVLLHPTFPESQIERLRQQTMVELRNRRVQPASLARRHLARGLYGGSPYGDFLIGNENSVAALTAADIQGFYDEHFRSAELSLVAVGDVDSEALEAIVEEKFAGAAARRPAADAPGVNPRALEGIEVIVVDRPGAAQTELRIGHVGIPRRHPDFTPVAVMNSILGGAFMSRININLRERHGYTYGASSHFARRRGPGPFVVATAVDTESAAAAAREILNEMRQIREQPVTAEELDDSRNFMLGAFPYTMQSIDGIAARLGELAVHDLPDDYYRKMPARLGAVTRDDIHRVARRHLDPERLLIVAVGPRKALENDLAGLGELSVVES